MWDWQETKEQTDLQISAVRLHRHRILSPTERPRHFSTLGTAVQWGLEERKRWIPGAPWPNLETEAGPADHYLPPAHRALWSECPSEEDWHFRHFPVWVRTSWPNPRPRPSVVPNIYWETSANMASGCWSGDQAVGLSRRPLPDGWFCGINQTEDLTCRAVDRWRRRRRRRRLFLSLSPSVSVSLCCSSSLFLSLFSPPPPPPPAPSLCLSEDMDGVDKRGINTCFRSGGQGGPQMSREPNKRLQQTQAQVDEVSCSFSWVYWLALNLVTATMNIYICICSAQWSMFYMEKGCGNKTIFILIIIRGSETERGEREREREIWYIDMKLMQMRCAIHTAGVSQFNSDI